MKKKNNVKNAGRPKRPSNVTGNMPETLDGRLRAHAQEQPEIMQLQKLLQSVGGGLLVAPPSVTRDLPFLIESGFVMDYPVTERTMEPHMCHLNSAELFATGKATAFGSGFALTEGLWLQHSWALKRQRDGTNRIIETTGRRERYFGILYWGILGKFVAKVEFQVNGVKPPASLDSLFPLRAAPINIS